MHARHHQTRNPTLSTVSATCQGCTHHVARPTLQPNVTIRWNRAIDKALTANNGNGRFGLWLGRASSEDSKYHPQEASPLQAGTIPRCQQYTLWIWDRGSRNRRPCQLVNTSHPRSMWERMHGFRLLRVADRPRVGEVSEGSGERLRIGKRTVHRSMILKPIPHVLHMKETIPTSRRTNNCCGFADGPDVRNSCSNISHG